MKTRAPAMAPDERREAIASATLQLLLEHGSNVTTRQIADAAGIAEGTIFRVFDDKDAVLRAAVDRAFDPVPLERAFAAIAPGLPLDQRLTAAVEVLQDRMRDIARLANALGGPAVFKGRRPLPAQALAAVVAPDRRCLRYPPERTAQLLAALTLAVGHPSLAGVEPASAQEIVSLFLDGARR